MPSGVEIATCSRMLCYARDHFEAHVGPSFAWLPQAGSKVDARVHLEAYCSLATSGQLRRADLPDVGPLLGPFASVEPFSFGHPVEVWLDGSWVGNGGETAFDPAIPRAIERCRFRTPAPRTPGAEVLGCTQSGPIRHELAKAGLARDFDTRVVEDGGFWVERESLQRWLDGADVDTKYEDWRASMRDLIARIRGAHQALVVVVDDPGPERAEGLG